MTGTQILNDIRKRVLELTTDIVDNASLLTWLNQVLKEIAYETPNNSRLTKETLSFSNGEAEVPNNYLSFYYAIDDKNREFVYLPLENFLENNGLNCLTIFEDKVLIKPNDVVSLDFYYYKKPTEITIDNLNEEVDLPEILQETLVLGTIARVFEVLQEPEMANNYLIKYRDSLMKNRGLLYSAQERGQESKPLFEDVNLL